MKRWLGALRVGGIGLLTLLGACAGRYDVGDTPVDGGSDGAGTTSTGGASSATGGTSSATGGASSATGGDTSNVAAGGAPDATGGSAQSGSAGTAGTKPTDSGSAGSSPSSGGTNGEQLSNGPLDDTACGARAKPPGFEYGDPAPLEVVWERFQTLVHGKGAVAGQPDFFAVTPEWAANAASNALADARGQEPPLVALSRFFETWLAVGDDESSDRAAALGAMSFEEDGATFASLIAPPDGQSLLKNPSLNVLRSGISGRGSWLSSSLFCVEAGPPDLGQVTVPEGSNLTRRQVLEGTVAPATCQGCHKLIDPLGYSLEGLDPLTGAPRSVDEHGLPIDSSGHFQSAKGIAYDFSSIDDLAPAFAQSCEVARCFVQKFTTSLAELNDLRPLNDAELELVLHEYAVSEFSLEGLFRAYVRTPAFLE